MVAAGNDLNSDYNTRFDGFIYMFSDDGDDLWNLASEGSGERLPGVDTLAFSSCSRKLACASCDTEQVYIVDVASGHAYRLTMAHCVVAIAFDPSGQRLITVHRASICIIDSMSGAKLHETPFSDSSLTIEALSWPKECNEDD